MLKKLFWENPYQTQLETHITAINGPELCLAESILYAFSGGQESDAGTIGGQALLEARKEGLEIFYRVEGAQAFSVGERVEVRLDWERRYRLMRLHFAAELILELCYRARAGIPKIGAHIAADKSRIDFEWDENLTPLLPALKAEAESLIEADHPIISAFSDEANQRRYWEIEGFARVACGGTHLRRTGEVGKIDLRRKNVGKSKERIEIYLRS